MTIDKKFIEVIDVSSEKFIGANSAYYLFNSKIKGTMSKKSKLAFKDKEEANKFLNLSSSILIP